MTKVKIEWATPELVVHGDLEALTQQRSQKVLGYDDGILQTIAGLPGVDPVAGS